MKVFSRLFVMLAALALVACGAEGERPDVQSNSVGMKAFIPQAAPLPKGADEYQQPDPEQGAPDEVRETGFEPGPEADGDIEDAPCLDCVRETGFVPAPVLHLAAVVDGVAELQWTVDDSVERMRVDAMRYGSDGHPTVSASYIVEGADRFAMPLDSQRTIATVTAIDEGGKVRSKKSNQVEAAP